MRGEKSGVANARRHLFIDGHNLLHAWGWMNAGESVARERLIEAARALGDAEGLDVTLVFDSRGAQAATDPAVSESGFSVRYAAAGLSADGEIERAVAAHATPQLCVVATGDALICGNALASGAEVISPDALHAWIERSRTRAQRALRKRMADGGRKFGNKLPL